MRPSKCMLALAALTIAAAPLQAQNRFAPLVPRFLEGSAADAVAAEFFDNIVYLPVTIGGKGPYSFVLDTGDDGEPFLNEKLARSLKIPLGSGRLLTGGAGSTPVEMFPIDRVDFCLPGLCFGAAPAATLPLDLMDAHWGKRKDGLIGGTVFAGLVTDIDYAGKTVRFRDPKTSPPPAGEAIPIEVRGQPFVRARVFLHGVPRPVEAFMMVDTGARVTTFNAPFSRRHRLPQQSPRTLATMTGFGINGATWGTIGRVQAIQLGSVRIEEPVVCFSTDRAGAEASDRYAGIIGADILRRFHVVFDYPGRRMALERNAEFGVPSEYDMSGLRLVAEGDRLDVIRIFHVAAKTPGEAVGLLAGDEIRAIDGRQASTFNWETLRAYLRRPGEPVRLEIVRGGRTIPVTLTLRRLV